MASLNHERLDTRRTTLSYSFALKCTVSLRHKTMFPPNLQGKYEKSQAIQGAQVQHLQVLQQFDPLPCQAPQQEVKS